MKLAATCLHCGVLRTWDTGSDGVVQQDQKPLHGAICTVSLLGICKPRSESSGERMIRDLAQRNARRRGLYRG